MAHRSWSCPGALSDVTAWILCAPLLATGRSVHVMNRRGKGTSGDADTYEPEREIDDVLAVLADVGRPADLLGHSSGAILGLQSAERAPAELRRLALYEPPVFLDPSDRILTDLADRLDVLLASGEEDAALETFLREAPRDSEADIQRLRDHHAAWPRMMAMVHTIPYDTRVQQGFDLDLGRLASMRTPTLMIVGAVSPPRYPERIARDRTGAARRADRGARGPGPSGAAVGTRPAGRCGRPIPVSRLRTSRTDAGSHPGAATCDTRPRGTPCHRHAVGDRDAAHLGHGGRGRRVRARRQRDRRRARGRGDACRQLSPQLRRGWGPVRAGAATRRSHDRDQRKRARPGAASTRTRSERGTAPLIPEAGPDPVTVPGAVSGWDALHREGARLPWGDAFDAGDRARVRRRRGVAITARRAGRAVLAPRSRSRHGGDLLP